MKRDSRLSLALHALVHMAGAKRSLTSDELGAMCQTNAAVVRRTFGGLRRAKLVKSVKGHGGGWALARPLARITLGDVYDALGTPAVFAMEHRSDNPKCLIERAVNREIEGALEEAHAVLLARFHKVSLAIIEGVIP